MTPSGYQGTPLPLSGTQAGREFLLKTGHEALFVKKVGEMPGQTVAMLMRGWAPCQDIKQAGSRIPQTSFNQQIFKVRITLSSQGLPRLILA